MILAHLNPIKTLNIKKGTGKKEYNTPKLVGTEKECHTILKKCVDLSIEVAV